MSLNYRILKYSLLAGSFYFFLVSIVHFFEIKVPVLFIYFNVPSYHYQDRIISFLALGWSIFLFTAFSNPQKQDALMKAILVAGGVAVFGLFAINSSTDFKALDPTIDPIIFTFETLGLLVYLAWLVIFYVRVLRKK